MDMEGGPPYVPVAERRRRAEREMAKLRKKGYPVSPSGSRGAPLQDVLGQVVVREPGELSRL